MSELTYTVETTTARVYKLRTDKGYGWANITIREWPKGGSIDVQSDYGSYSYTWSSIGAQSLRAFLVGLDFGYFMGKARPGYMRFDMPATVAEVRKGILSTRRDGDMTREVARELFDNLSLFDDCGSEESFYDVFCHHFQDYCDPYDAPNRHTADGQSLAFWENVWPAACAYWRDELAQASNDNLPRAKEAS